MFNRSPLTALLALAMILPAAAVNAQLVVLPAPRLLTTMPMGGQAGTSVEVTITGENIENVTELLFSTPKITAKPVTDAQGKAVEGKFLVTIAVDAPVGVYDARVLSRVAGDAALRREKGALGRERSREFSWDETARRTFEEFEKSLR